MPVTENLSEICILHQVKMRYISIGEPKKLKYEEINHFIQ